MNYVDFFGHKVSKLIVGDNPFNGHSYITEYIYRQEMIDYHTEDKILEAMHKMEELGVNTMLPLADPYIIRILQHYRSNGGKMNFIFQTYSPMMLSLESASVSMNMMLSVEPIGIYLSGTYTDLCHETNTMPKLYEMLAHLRSFDIKLGLGTHYPEIVERSEREHWDIDFYMACMYNLRRGREGEQSGFITGKNKSLIRQIIPSDREVMLETLRKVEKPIIAFKIFAGGQMLVEREEEDRRARIKDAYNTIFTTLKPNDFAVAGVFQKYHDQIRENVEVLNAWYDEKRGN